MQNDAEFCIALLHYNLHYHLHRILIECGARFSLAVFVSNEIVTHN